MSTVKTKTAMKLTLTELENLIRRVVREELERRLGAPPTSAVDDWSQEGPEDAAGDEELLAEALIAIQQYERNPEGVKSLEEFEREVAELGSSEKFISFLEERAQEKAAIPLEKMTEP